MEKTFADLLRDFPYAGHRWHGLRRGGAAAAFHRSPRPGRNSGFEESGIFSIFKDQPHPTPSPQLPSMRYTRQ